MLRNLNFKHQWIQWLQVKSGIAACFSEIMTIKDHLTDGGFGSWLLESLPAGRGLRERIFMKALDSVVCGTVGSQKVLNELGGFVL